MTAGSGPLKADLHVHTCLSPCAELEMNPREIVERALGCKLDLLAVCDHNSALNVPGVVEAARGSGLTVLPGIEICSAEEVHVVALFPDCEAAQRVGQACRDTLRTANDPARFGPQVVVDASGSVLAFEDRLLAAATTFSVEEACRLAARHSGLVILAHADRESYGILGQLGFIPPGLPFDGVEVTSRAAMEAITAQVQGPVRFTASSDAHFLHELGKRYSWIRCADRTLAGVADALRRGLVEPVFA